MIKITKQIIKLPYNGSYIPAGTVSSIVVRESIADSALYKTPLVIITTYEKASHVIHCDTNEMARNVADQIAQMIGWVPIDLSLQKETPPTDGV